MAERASESACRIGICADVLLGWAGGRDLVVMTSRALRTANPSARLWLLVPGKPRQRPKLSWKSFRYAIKDAVKALIGRPRLKQSPETSQAEAVEELAARLRNFIPDLEVRYSAALDDGLARAAADLRLDAVYLAMRLPKPRPACALVGYVPDYQHRHLPHLFSAKELAERDEVFGRLVGGSDAMVMNARAVAEDMRRFTPGPLPGLHVLPFSPNLNPEWLQDRPDLLASHGVSGRYFIVCNQFWMHKDHLTAFRAMATIAGRHPDVSLICTGGTSDYRDPAFFGKLQAEAEKLELGPRLRFVGHIAKRDQIELLKHAVALIQPTLFEGGPGGGATYEAIALGRRVLLSDLPVNREVDEGDVRYFPAGDHLALAGLMSAVLHEEADGETPSSLLAKNEARLSSYGKAAWTAVQAAVEASRSR